MASIGHNLRNVNVGIAERVASLIFGTVLAIYGVRQKHWSGIALAAAGGGLIYRGLAGHSGLYEALGLSTGERTLGPSASVQANRALKIEQAVIVKRLPAELFNFRRNIENLPQIMRHIESGSWKRRRSLPQAAKAAGSRSHVTRRWGNADPQGEESEWDLT